MQLFGYWRSTASYRVRIALALKGLKAEHVPVNLALNGGEQKKASYRQINPQGRVPALLLGQAALIQSPAIIEFLEETYPLPPLLPREPLRRAQVRAVAAIVACDIHPLHNSGPLSFLRSTLDVAEDDVMLWIRHWIADGLTAIEDLIDGVHFAFGEQPGLADVYLVPQVYAARRFGVDLEAFPKIRGVEAAGMLHPAFQKTHPDEQEDACLSG
jgi:maleylacetoacetate isomerase